MLLKILNVSNLFRLLIVSRTIWNGIILDETHNLKAFSEDACEFRNLQNLSHVRSDHELFWQSTENSRQLEVQLKNVVSFKTNWFAF